MKAGGVRRRPLTHKRPERDTNHRAGPEKSVAAPFRRPTALLMAWLGCLLILGGCTAASIGPTSSYFRHEKVTAPDGTVTESLVISEAEAGEARGDGASRSDSGSAATSEQGGGASGSKRELIRASGLKVLYYVGGGLVVLGILASFLPFIGWKLGGAVAAGGLALIAVGRLLDVYPWVVLVLVPVGLAIAGIAVYKFWRGRNAVAVAQAVVPEVEKLDELIVDALGEEDPEAPGANAKLAEQVARLLKKRIGRAAGESYMRVKREVLNIKKRAGIGGGT